MNRIVPGGHPELEDAGDPVFETAEAAEADEAAIARAIMELLGRRPQTVDETAEAFDFERSEAVKHLDSLHRQGLVRRRRAGNRIFYYPSDLADLPGF